MASRRPLQCMQTLRQQLRTHIYPSRLGLPRYLSTTIPRQLEPIEPNTELSSRFEDVPKPLGLYNSIVAPQNSEHEQAANTRKIIKRLANKESKWVEVVKPKGEPISYTKYLELQRRPGSEGGKLAIEGSASSELLTASVAPDDADLHRARLIPESASYFTTAPKTTDDIVHLSMLLRKYKKLPTLPQQLAPKVIWKSLLEYRLWIGERTGPTRYMRIKGMLFRLNRIVPELRTVELVDAITAHLRPAVSDKEKVTPRVLDEWGRGFGQGRRKTSRANAYVVEGSGQVMINERNITDVFGRVKDRESALWPLTATGRMQRYNVFVVVSGGGTSGQAEATALAVAQALLVHEPGLKSAMRRAGCITRDPRMVERKKPGHLKARKMPTWVKR